MADRNRGLGRLRRAPRGRSCTLYYSAPRAPRGGSWEWKSVAWWRMVLVALSDWAVCCRRGSLVAEAMLAGWAVIIMGGEAGGLGWRAAWKRQTKLPALLPVRRRSCVA